MSLQKNKYCILMSLLQFFLFNQFILHYVEVVRQLQ